jgi:hypothetical protein
LPLLFRLRADDGQLVDQPHHARHAGATVDAQLLVVKGVDAAAHGHRAAVRLDRDLTERGDLPPQEKVHHPAFQVSIRPVCRPVKTLSGIALPNRTVSYHVLLLWNASVHANEFSVIIGAHGKGKINEKQEIEEIASDRATAK